MAAIEPEFFCELPRYAELRKLRSYYDSSQYDGRADFFTGRKAGSNEVVPLRERKPCIIYPLPKSATHQVVRFTFGESRFPTIGIEKIDADQSVAGEKLSEDDAETLEKFVAELIERCQLKPAMRRLMRPGVAVGTAAAILSLEDGTLKLDVANAEDILPEFKGGKPGNEVLRAVWAYQYVDSVPGKDGRPQSKRFWFRQDITQQEFIEYAPVEARPNERPAWRESRRVPHNFGFCPVVWVRNLSESDTKQIDGQSLYDGLEEEFDALNFALSQRHRGINFFGVPQAWETGVEEDDGPQASGRVARGYSAAAPAAGGKSPYGMVLGADGRPARKIGPDQAWTYRGKDAKVGLLETTGKAFESGTLHVNDIRARALEAMSVVLVNLSEIMGRTQQGQMSAKFLELAYEPLLALVDEMRHCWWPHGLQAILSAALRIVTVRKGEGIYIPGAKKAAAILKNFVINTTAGPMWMPPKMTPAWGDYFAAGPEEIQKAIDAATKAKDGRLVPEADASKYVLHYFGREDATEALAQIESDKAKAQKAAVDNTALETERLHAQASALTAADKPAGKTDGAEPGAAPGGASRAKRAKPKKTARGGSGGTAAAPTTPE